MVPDTVFVDSCSNGYCDFYVYQKLGTTSLVDTTALSVNCPACNFMISKNCHGSIVSPDSNYWYKQTSISPETIETRIVERLRGSPMGDLLNIKTNTKFRIGTIDEVGTMLPIKIHLNAIDTDRFCRIGFLPSLSRKEIINSRSGQLNERSFQNDRFPVDTAEIVWSERFLIYKLTPFDILMREMLYVSSLETFSGETKTLYDTVGVSSLDSLLAKHHYDKMSISRDELNHLRHESKCRIMMAAIKGSI